VCFERVRVPGGSDGDLVDMAGRCKGGMDRALTFGDRIDDVNKHCLTEFRKHWECLDNNNQQLWQCRRWERPLNKCVFDNLVSGDSCSRREAAALCGRWLTVK